MEALTKLADAVGRPSPAALEKAKALFPFIAQESALQESALQDSGLRESGADDREPVAVSEAGQPESHG
ncbi:hypothetical protein ACGF5F_08430 [Streptomyces sp. NPDC047821]|uniref:hypothetical protein n=1 Tax=Streptomyces sp. NPDC047821 TaxID=3365488 RepID=UPI00371CA0D6